MSKNHTRRKPATPTVLDDAGFRAPKRKPQTHTTLAEAIAEQAEEEGRAPEEVAAELAAPAPEEAPVKPAKEPGTSNLACTIRQHRHRYVPALHPVSGKKTANNGDAVAKILLTVSLEDLARFVHGWCGKEYSRLNPGHNRMCCGNLVRAAAAKSDPVVLQQLAIWAGPEVAEETEAAE